MATYSVLGISDGPDKASAWVVIETAGCVQEILPGSTRYSRNEAVALAEKLSQDDCDHCDTYMLDIGGRVCAICRKTWTGGVS